MPQVQNTRQHITMVEDRGARPEIALERRHPQGPHETPLFFNELGVKSIEIGVDAFHCMGVLPPHDHPHVYLNMGEDTALLCPYCSTEYVLNPELSWNQTRPAHCWAVGTSAA